MHNQNLLPEKPRILLVEDNEMNRRVVQQMLEKKGYVCDIAVTGKEAVEIVVSKDYDIILMDCQMPVMDGFKATDEIRRFQEPEKHSCIIAMTADTLSEDKARCISAGMDDYLPKPVSFEELQGIIDKYWENSNFEDKKGSAKMVDTWYEMDFMKDGLKEFMEKNGFDEKISKKLYNDFVDQLSHTISSMEAALANSNMIELSELAHQLKGSSGMLRIGKIAELCSIIEIEAKNGDKIEVSEALKKIKWLFDL